MLTTVMATPNGSVVKNAVGRNLTQKQRERIKKVIDDLRPEELKEIYTVQVIDVASRRMRGLHLSQGDAWFKDGVDRLWVVGPHGHLTWVG